MSDFIDNLVVLMHRFINLKSICSSTGGLSTETDKRFDKMFKDMLNTFEEFVIHEYKLVEHAHWLEFVDLKASSGYPFVMGDDINRVFTSSLFRRRKRKNDTM